LERPDLSRALEGRTTRTTGAAESPISDKLLQLLARMLLRFTRDHDNCAQPERV